MKNSIIITCEHASNRIPDNWKYLFDSSAAREDLNTHLGYDLGSRDAAVFFAKYFKCPMFLADYSRLLIELNITLTNKKLFSKYTDHLSSELKEKIINDYYDPYRKKVEDAISREIAKNKCVVHLSIHSFTPVLNNHERRTDIGLLYDPKRECEKKLCSIMKSNYSSQFNKKYRIRFNYPYKGIDDGFTTYFRKTMPSNNYLGIEVEINQKYANQNKFPDDLIESLARVIQSSVTDI